MINGDNTILLFPFHWIGSDWIGFTHYYLVNHSINSSINSFTCREEEQDRQQHILTTSSSLTISLTGSIIQQQQVLSMLTSVSRIALSEGMDEG